MSWHFRDMRLKKHLPGQIFYFHVPVCWVSFCVLLPLTKKQETVTLGLCLYTQTHTPNHGHRASESPRWATVKWLICWLLLSGLWCYSGYWLGSKSRGSPPSPVITLLSPSTSAESQRVLLFSSQHPLLRDKSLAELNRHTCVTPGYRLLSLIFLLNWRSVLFRSSVLRSTSRKVHQKPFRTMYLCVDVANCSTLGREFPAVTERETRWGRFWETEPVFREQTEGSPNVSRQALMSLSNKVEGGKHSQPSVCSPSSQQDIKYSVSTPLVIWGVKLDSFNVLYC